MQNLSMWHYLLAGGGLFVLTLLCFLTYRVRYWWREGNKLQEVGYLTPRVTIFARFARWILGWMIVWYKCGRYKVYGREHLRGNRRKIIMPNHQIEHDAIVIPTALRMLYFRGLMAITQIVGFRKPIAAWLGVVPVHHDKNPMAAVRVSVKVLKAEDDSSMVAFPQGELVRDNNLQLDPPPGKEGPRFYAGPILIARMAAPKGGPIPFWFVPAGVYYDRDPRHASYMQRFLRWLGLKSFRGWFGEVLSGVTVVFGEPIAFDNLPQDKDEARKVVFEKIKECSDRARDLTLKAYGEKVPVATCCG